MENVMITNWIQAICSILMVIIAALGVFRTLPKISKDINKNVNESWKRLIDLYAKNSKLHEYSNIKDKD